MRTGARRLLRTGDRHCLTGVKNKIVPVTGKRAPDTGSAAQLVREGADRLRQAGLPHARQEAEWLLSHLAGGRPLEVYLRDAEIPPATIERFRAQLEARASGVPLQYLLGEADFLGLRLKVGPGVFIPRPETEAVLEQAIEALRALERSRGRPLRLLDLGTGSGCIAAALARALPTCVVVGVEVSYDALQTARLNIQHLSLQPRVWLIQGSWAEAIRAPVDGIVANPPYVPSAQVDRLPLEVRQEPRGSLDGGPDGLDRLREIMTQAGRLLAPGGLLVMECGEEHVERLVRSAETTAWVKTAQPLRDLTGRLRGMRVSRTTRPVIG